MIFLRSNSVEKQLSNFRNAFVSRCFKNSSLTIIWNNLGLSYHKCMKRNLEFGKKRYLKRHLSINVQQNILPRTMESVERCHKCIRVRGLSFE